MADTETSTHVEMTKEERIAAAKARAAERAGATAASAARPAAEGEEGPSEAAQRFQAIKEGQKATPSRKEREAALLNRAVDIAPRASIEAMPQAAPRKADVLPINRREFLTYAWGGAMGLVLAQGGLATLWFSYPRFKEGEFGGVFTLTDVPEAGVKPGENLTGKFWWANTADGIAALYKVCTHLGCLFEWKDQTSRFECPCHGSKFNQAGRVIHGPAARDLDQFVVTVFDGAGAQIDQTTEDHRYVNVVDGASYKIDTGRKLVGHPSDPALQVEA